jgi:hypothetical protein
VVFADLSLSHLTLSNLCCPSSCTMIGPHFRWRVGASLILAVLLSYCSSGGAGGSAEAEPANPQAVDPDQTRGSARDSTTGFAPTMVKTWMRSAMMVTLTPSRLASALRAHTKLDDSTNLSSTRLALTSAIALEQPTLLQRSARGWPAHRDPSSKARVGTSGFWQGFLSGGREPHPDQSHSQKSCGLC